MRMFFLHCFTFFFFSLSVCFCQPFQVGHKQQTFIDVSRGNRNITTEIYYPANSAGNNAPIASGQFPVLVFGHGFLMVWSAYDVYWNALVPNGYIMVFPTTETSFSPSHLEFGKDIGFLVSAMKAEGINPSSTFFGSVGNTSAVMGHSMGGGAAFLSVQYDSSITALATFAAANTNPSSIAAAKNILIPSIIFSGTNDCITPPVQHQLPMYDSLASFCKTFISITGGSHCQFANYNVNCYIGEGTCTPQPTITPATQQTTTFNLLLPWLNFFLKNDCSAGIQFQNLISATAGITSQQNCSLICTAISEPTTSSFLKIVPNPFSTQTVLQTDNSFHNATLMVNDIFGQTVSQIQGISGQTITFNRGDLPCGLYFVRLIEGNKITGIGKLIISDK